MRSKIASQVEDRRALSGRRRAFAGFAVLATFIAVPCSHAQVNGLGTAPYLGWSSWSQASHTFKNSSGTPAGGMAWVTAAQIKTQSDYLKLTGLQAHGFDHINIDGGWALQHDKSTDSVSYYDAYGRPLADSTKFPDGMADVAHYIHANGQKAGIYWVPGVPKVVAAANLPVLNTPYHMQDILVQPNTAGNNFHTFYKIDFTKPGAQEYVDSIVDLFASWGFDLIKLDAVTPYGSPGSGAACSNGTCIDNRSDVQAWSSAIAHSGRKIWLTISWALDHDYLNWWQTYANARRIEGDIECYTCLTTITEWARVAQRFSDLPAWQLNAGPAQGWNDLDSLEVGNGTNTNNGNTLVSGLTEDERRSMITLWAIANAPLYIGDDLTQLDSFGLQLLTNHEVLGVDRSGYPGQRLTPGSDGNTPVWVSHMPDGTYYVALFNLNSTAATASITWAQLGIGGTAKLWDVWAQTMLGVQSTGYSTTLQPHATQFIRIIPGGA